MIERKFCVIIKTMVLRGDYNTGYRLCQNFHPSTVIIEMGDIIYDEKRNQRIKETV